VTRYAADLAAVRAAAARVAGRAKRTPIARCGTLDALAGRSLFFKCEQYQKSGSFKFRGACNAVESLDAAAAQRGVAAHSSGNFAQALALAARARGIDAHLVMPSNAPAVKRSAVLGYGARVVVCEPTLAAREAALAEVLAETGATPLHPYDHDDVIAGQGTAALEMLEDVPDLDAIVAPVGGGGLVSGLAIAATALRPGIRVFAAEPAGADDAARSKRAGRVIPMGRPDTIADGLLTSLGERTWPVLRDLVEDVVVVSEAEIVAAMRLAWERGKLLVEPSAAVALAAVLAEPFRARAVLARVGVVLSGGNVDLDRLPWAAR
jgi:threonine dehydratase/serine racemase